MVRNVWRRVRSAFVAGVLVAVPLGLTIWVLVALVGFLDAAIHLLPNQLEPENLLGVKIPGLGVLLALTIVLSLGLLTRSYIGLRLIRGYEWLFGRVPILSSVYQGLKQLTEALFGSEGRQFQQVVLVEWPRPGVYAVAFHTGEAFVLGADGLPLVNLFLPTTPNPTSGFYLMLPASEVRHLDLSVEDAFKLIMSAGIVQPGQPRQLTEEVPRDVLGSL